MAAEAAFQMLTGDFLALNQTAWQPLTQRVRDAENRIARLHMEPHRRWANGFSCLCFVMVGAPLAVVLRNADFLTAFFICFFADPDCLLSAVDVQSGSSQIRRNPGVLRLAGQRDHGRLRVLADCGAFCGTDGVRGSRFQVQCLQVACVFHDLAPGTWNGMTC